MGERAEREGEVSLNGGGEANACFSRWVRQVVSSIKQW